MCNCNQKRVSFAAENSKNRELFDAHPGMNQVKLTQQAPLKINGDVTGRIYSFKKIDAVIWVDKRDLMNMKNIIGLQLL